MAYKIGIPDIFLKIEEIVVIVSSIFSIRFSTKVAQSMTQRMELMLFSC